MEWKRKERRERDGSGEARGEIGMEENVKEWNGEARRIGIEGKELKWKIKGREENEIAGTENEMEKTGMARKKLGHKGKRKGKEYEGKGRERK